jgi:hypothetical protein
MMTETNLSDNYRKGVIKLLYIFSKYNKDKPFRVVTREDILAFLDSFRRSEASDPMHKWIGTYNTYRIHLLRFFKWLYYPDVEPDNFTKSLFGEENVIYRNSPFFAGLGGKMLEKQKNL